MFIYVKEYIKINMNYATLYFPTCRCKHRGLSPSSCSQQAVQPTCERVKCVSVPTLIMTPKMTSTYRARRLVCLSKNLTSFTQLHKRILTGKQNCVESANTSVENRFSCLFSINFVLPFSMKQKVPQQKLCLNFQ